MIPRETINKICAEGFKQQKMKASNHCRPGRCPTLSPAQVSYFSYGAAGLKAVLTRINTAKISHPRSH
jgi:hypothetical protein